MNYWDTSCLLKLYVSEPDSPVWLDSVRQQTSPILTSVLTETEFAFALMRKEAEGELRPRPRLRSPSFYGTTLLKGRSVSFRSEPPSAIWQRRSPAAA